MSASILETCKLLTRWAFEYFDQTSIPTARVRKAIGYAFLVPEIVRAIVERPTAGGADVKTTSSIIRSLLMGRSRARFRRDAVSELAASASVRTRNGNNVCSVSLVSKKRHATSSRAVAHRTPLTRLQAFEWVDPCPTGRCLSSLVAFVLKRPTLGLPLDLMSRTRVRLVPDPEWFVVPRILVAAISA